MPALSEDTDRRFAESVVARGLVPLERVRELQALREKRVAAGAPDASIAEMLCERKLLDRKIAAAVLRDLRAGRDVPTLRDRPSLGRILHYTLERELGKGGMGIVYQARDERLGRLVAIKMIRPAPGTNEEDVQRFVREARTVAGLQHPGIVTVFDVGAQQGRPFLVMELIQGESLEAVLGRGPLPIRRAVEIARDLAIALDHAHSRGVVHRDLKPGNVMIASDERPRLMDFGLAWSARATRITQVGDLLGTPAYMAPEQANADREAQGPPTDVYGLGAVLYRALAGRPIFEARGLEAALKKVLIDPPVPPRQLRPEIPEELEAIVLRCLAKKPGERYTTARDLADALSSFLDSKPAIAARSRPSWVFIVLPLLAGAVGVGSALALRPAEPAPPAAVVAPVPVPDRSEPATPAAPPVPAPSVPAPPVPAPPAPSEARLRAAELERLEITEEVARTRFAQPAFNDNFDVLAEIEPRRLHASEPRFLTGALNCVGFAKLAKGDLVGARAACALEGPRSLFLAFCIALVAKDEKEMDRLFGQLGPRLGELGKTAAVAARALRALQRDGSSSEMSKVAFPESARIDRTVFEWTVAYLKKESGR